MGLLYSLIIQVGLANVPTVECGNFDALVADAKSALWIGDVPLMQQNLQEAERSLDCTKVMNTDTMQASIGDFVLLKAYFAHLEQQEDHRTFWLQQSVNLQYWNPNFGPEIQSLREDLRPTEPIVISILPAVGDGAYQMTVDGDVVDSYSASEGIHWIEVYNQDQRLFAQFMNVQTGSFIDLSAIMSVDPVKGRVSVWAAGAVFFATTALSTHTAAMSSHQQYGAADSLADLEDLRVQTWRWGQGSIASGVLAVLCLAKWAGDTWRMDSDQTSVNIVEDVE